MPIFRGSVIPPFSFFFEMPSVFIIFMDSFLQTSECCFVPTELQFSFITLLSSSLQSFMSFISLPYIPSVTCLLSLLLLTLLSCSQKIIFCFTFWLACWIYYDWRYYVWPEHVPALILQPPANICIWHWLLFLIGLHSMSLKSRSAISARLQQWGFFFLHP